MPSVDTRPRAPRREHAAPAKRLLIPAAALVFAVAWYVAIRAEAAQRFAALQGESMQLAREVMKRRREADPRRHDRVRELGQGRVAERVEHRDDLVITRPDVPARERIRRS